MAHDVLVQAEWGRPPWCRQDWCRIRLFNGYRYYCLVDRVVFDEGNVCWVRANAGNLEPSSLNRICVRFTDHVGEGSVDYVPASMVQREVT